jgi:hypothetical protein
VVVVEEDGEQPDVVSRGLELLVGFRPDGTRGFGAGPDVAVRADELEEIDLLGLSVLLHFEIGRRQVVDGIAALVGDDDVHPDRIDARAEHRRPLLRILGLGLLRARSAGWRRGRRRLPPAAVATTPRRETTAVPLRARTGGMPMLR